MIEIAGKYGTAKIFTDNGEPSALQQIEYLMNREFVRGSKVRVMPDVHAGMGCTIGTTMTITDKVVPNLVGVDIGCGMETAILSDSHIDCARLDIAIHQHIPAGFKIRKTPCSHAEKTRIRALRCAKHMDIKRAELSVGTLGGGNHFIEMGRCDDGVLLLVVHSGSRNLGKQVCEWYQKAAAQSMPGSSFEERALAYLEGRLMDDYLHDMAIMQAYADTNRKAILQELAQRVGFTIAEQFSTIHNYIDLDTMILRKGAVSAKKGERLLIPMNMRDGSLICMGLGNDDWNQSAPHGAGRIMSRTQARAKTSLAQFKKSMEGIYSSTVDKNTLDEAPSVYKPMAEIVANIAETVEIVKTVRPLYNFKSA